MIITRPHKNIIRILLDDVKEKKKAYNYLIQEGCVKTKYVEPFLVAAPEYLGQLKHESEVK
tara:strand:- start:66 stop:248 length:183 start_codon:yes stop_codon:yes gene_type:complete